MAEKSTTAQREMQEDKELSDTKHFRIDRLWMIRNGGISSIYKERGVTMLSTPLIASLNRRSHLACQDCPCEKMDS